MYSTTQILPGDQEKLLEEESTKLINFTIPMGRYFSRMITLWATSIPENCQRKLFQNCCVDREVMRLYMIDIPLDRMTKVSGKVLLLVHLYLCLTERHVTVGRD